MANQNQDIQFTKHFINNQFVDSKNGKTYANYNPTTGRVLTQIAEGDHQDVNYAVDCAKRAFYTKESHWRTMDAYHRGLLLHKLANLMERNMDVLANLETMDHGKPRHYAMEDVDYAIRTVRYYAGYADKFHGKTIPIDDRYSCFTRKEPYGIVGQILPSNNPIIMFIWKLAPAIATGNCVILKPATQTPLTALYMAHLTKLAGFPDGVVNIICGNGEIVGRAILNHNDIKKITFSGSTKNGMDVMDTMSKHYLKHLSMNLSASNPMVIFHDYDLDEAVRKAHECLFRNQGQNSSAAHRVYVHENIYDDFVRRATDLARKRKIGNSFDYGVQHGPVTDEKKMMRILNFIETTKKEGAMLQCGGKRHGTHGYYIEPTVFSHCTDNMRCATEDLYGPVQYIFKFKNYDEVVNRLNQNYYALACGIFTNDLKLALNFTHDMEYGTIWVNDYQAVYPQTPYGGFKWSGWDHELGYSGLYLYLKDKVCTYSYELRNFQNY